MTAEKHTHVAEGRVGPDDPRYTTLARKRFNKRFVGNLMRKLDLRSVARLTQFAIKEGLVDAP